MTVPKNVTLMGTANPMDVRPSFVVPVFQNVDGIWLQDGTEEAIRTFLECELEEANFTRFADEAASSPSRRLIADRNSLTRTVGDRPYYAFEFENGDIAVAEPQRLRQILEDRLAEIRPHVFVYIDVCDFLGKEDGLSDACGEARLLLEGEDSGTADRWISDNVYRGRAILVVDDELEVCHALREALSRRLPRVEVVTAFSASDALDILKRRRVAVAVIDLRLEGTESGLEITNWIAQNSPKTAPIVLTAYGSVEAVRASFKAGAVDFVEKGSPNFADVLYEVVHASLCKSDHASRDFESLPSIQEEPMARLRRRFPSLADIPGLEELDGICCDFDVQFTAHGGLVRRLAFQWFYAEVVDEPITIFDLIPGSADIDLLHSGSPEQTPDLTAQILKRVPEAQCFRWELRSVEDQWPFDWTMRYSPAVPVNLMRLSTGAEGIVDPKGGIQDIELRSLRYERNPRFQRSPLRKSGDDIEACSALLYLKSIMEAECLGVPARLAMHPGIEEAKAALARLSSRDETLVVQANQKLAARLLYLLKAAYSSSPSEARWQEVVKEIGLLDSLEELRKALSPSWVDAAKAVVSSGNRAVVTSSWLGGTEFRLPHLTEWVMDSLEVLCILRTLGVDSLEQGLLTRDSILFSTRPMELNLGESPSCMPYAEYEAEQEFFHVFGPVCIEKPVCSLLPGQRLSCRAVVALTGLEDNTGVEERYRLQEAPPGLFSLPGVCCLQGTSDVPRVAVRVNCLSLLAPAWERGGLRHKPPKTIRVFVLRPHE